MPLFKKSLQIIIKRLPVLGQTFTFYLSIMYKTWEGVKQNKSKAKELYGKACDNGNNTGCKNYAKQALVMRQQARQANLVDSKHFR